MRARRPSERWPSESTSDRLSGLSVPNDDGELMERVRRWNPPAVSTGEDVHSGDLALAHKQLETVRPAFQEIFKRNGFSMLSISLVDFHDAMELILDPANAKDAQQVIAIYSQVSEKLRAVEAEANDAEIGAIRANLDELMRLARSGATDALPAQAGKLKSSFM
jgi:hypothetical protein